MPAPNYATQGWVARTLSRARAILDGNLSDVTGQRMGRYGEALMLAPMIGEPLLADEGSLMMASMLPSATALQLGLSASYAATAAALVFKNNAPAGPASPRCHLRDIHFLCATAPASGTGLLYATLLDNVNRAPTTVSGLGSPGTAANQTAYQAPAVCANIDENPTISGVWWFPLSTSGGAPPVVPAQGSNARVLVGNGNLRAVIPVGAASSGVQDDYRIVFGATDRGVTSALRSTAGATQITEVHPAVTVGPQEFVLLYLWAPSNAVTGMAFAGLDCSWFER
jgi:hypothetical protein